MTEIWKDIEGYEGYYQVSNLGYVRSLDRIVKASKGGVQAIKGRILRFKKSRGYDSVGLSRDGVNKYYRVSRLVAMAFIPNPDGLPQVNHKDVNPHNNRVDNLEWCDAKYNCNYGEHNKKLSLAAKMRFQDPEQYGRLLDRIHR